MKSWRRFCVVSPTVWLELAAIPGFALSRGVVADLSNDDLLIDCEFDDAQFAAAQRDARLLLLPSLSAPAARLAAGTQSLFSREGIAPAPDDSLFDLLRRLRNARGSTYDISNPT